MLLFIESIAASCKSMMLSCNLDHEDDVEKTLFHDGVAFRAVDSRYLVVRKTGED